MKIVLALALLFPVSLHVGAQNIDKCPNGKQRMEIAVTLNTSEPSYPLGSLKGDAEMLDGGDFKNKTVAIGLMGKYFLNDDNNEAFRFRFVFTNKNIRDYRELWGSPGPHSIYDIHYTQRYYKISPGFQWTFSKNRISLFGGIEAPVTIIGKNKQTLYALNESIEDPSFYDEGFSVQLIDGGYSAGLGLFFGSNYFFTRNIGIGFDFFAAYLYTNVGGKIHATDQAHGTHGDVNIDTELYESIKEYKFSPIQGAINLTYKF